MKQKFEDIFWPSIPTSSVSISEWRDRIARAKQNTYFNSDDEAKASNWNKCAVGERDKICRSIMPSNVYAVGSNDFIQEHFSDKAYRLGLDFATAVKEDDIFEAERILNKIEKMTPEEFYGD